MKKSKKRKTKADYKAEVAELQRRFIEQQAAAQIITLLNHVESQTGVTLSFGDYAKKSGPSGEWELIKGDLSWITTTA